MRYVESYLHQNRVGVMIELETPDVITLRCKEFKTLALDLAMQIAATDPVGIDSHDMLNVVPTQFRKDVGAVSGEALLDQEWIKDANMTVGAMLNRVEVLLKTPIRIVRFVRYGVGDT